MKKNDKLDVMMSAYVLRDVEPMNFKEQKHFHIRAVSAVAAALVLILTLGIIFFPFGAKAGFVITASAASGAELTDKGFTKIGEFQMSGGGYTPDSMEESFYIDLAVEGEDIETVTYHMKRGVIVVSDSSEKILSYEGKSRTYSPAGDEDLGSSVEGASCYTSVTCAYDNQFTAEEDDFQMMTGGVYGVDYDKNKIDPDFYTKLEGHAVFAQDPADMIDKAEFEAHYNSVYGEVFKDEALYITVTYTNGRTETQEVRFTTDAEADVVADSWVFVYMNDDGTYNTYKDLDAYTEARDNYSRGWAIGGVENLEKDADGFYHDIQKYWDDDGNEHEAEVTFTDDDVITIYQYGLDINLEAKLA